MNFCSDLPSISDLLSLTLSTPPASFLNVTHVYAAYAEYGVVVINTSKEGYSGPGGLAAWVEKI